MKSPTLLMAVLSAALSCNALSAAPSAESSPDADTQAIAVNEMNRRADLPGAQMPSDVSEFLSEFASEFTSSVDAAQAASTESPALFSSPAAEIEARDESSSTVSLDASPTPLEPRAEFPWPRVTPNVSQFIEEAKSSADALSTLTPTPTSS
ncbi:hypothetical protein NUU61_006754 [Penicillium alfredii]|uniref:Uncharacterized protein n=1 Tax=Penicillium alfredii TaxID=1506179 RepID=A0A9W9F1L1_9EURO|nr:uncharacterized protein NUU61_006754 [Penicillium alfredii]KAJ5091884.1 hypothetical protein NUU61_006754 [Penicillium alfredii]